MFAEIDRRLAPLWEEGRVGTDGAFDRFVKVVIDSGHRPATDADRDRIVRSPRAGYYVREAALDLLAERVDDPVVGQLLLEILRSPDAWHGMHHDAAKCGLNSSDPALGQAVAEYVTRPSNLNFSGSLPLEMTGSNHPEYL